MPSPLIPSGVPSISIGPVIIFDGSYAHFHNPTVRVWGRRYADCNVVNWVRKDGLGYLSKILLSKFSWHFYVNPKGWRLFTDLLENTACGLEILTLNFASSHEQITQYLSNPQYYFHVNSQHVRNKLKVIMFPFLHQGHWTRITEPVGGMLLYKPPIQDINAQDLYIPLMAFGTYVVIASYALGVLGRSLYIQNNFVCSVLRVGRYGMNSVGGPEHRGCYAPLISARTLKFTPMSLTLQFTKGLLGWFLRVILIRVLLYSLESGEASLLDVVAYAGYRLLVHHL